MGREDGFTLVELLIAMMILAVVLTAIAPAFYGALRSTANTSQRSVADGLAVAAVEQIRSLPYYEVGYFNTPSTCTYSTTPVSLTSASPMDSLSTSSTTAGTTYT